MLNFKNDGESRSRGRHCSGFQWSFQGLDQKLSSTSDSGCVLELIKIIFLTEIYLFSSTIVSCASTGQVAFDAL